MSAASNADRLLEQAANATGLSDFGDLPFREALEAQLWSLEHESGHPAERLPALTGGLAATLNEIAHQSDLGFRLQEEAIPVKPGVAAACELLGLDPLHVANEGKLVAIVAPEASVTVPTVPWPPSSAPERMSTEPPSAASSCAVSEPTISEPADTVVVPVKAEPSPS